MFFIILGYKDECYTKAIFMFKLWSSIFMSVLNYYSLAMLQQAELKNIIISKLFELVLA